MYKYTKFEQARIIGARALQIECGAPPLIKVDSTMTPIQVAQEEMRRGTIPIVVMKNDSGA
ncbi:DNA-directed RNA polymerase subunit K [Candidatus Micrarchaeota archaeon]|nr:DNA-directed RNA polymerase subunit K [Candidatus Micrarchaeota archaeon]